jgi:hypothetical protein
MDSKQLEESKNKYNFILNNKHYVDISFLGVLKILLKNHKIHRSEYKNAIRKFIIKKPLPNSIYSKIHFYLHTRKSRTSKNTLIAVTKRSELQHKRFIPIRYENNQNYAVFLKKAKFLQYTQNKQLSSEYKDLMLMHIKREFKHKITQENLLSSGFGGGTQETA